MDIFFLPSMFPSKHLQKLPEYPSLSHLGRGHLRRPAPETRTDRMLALREWEVPLHLQTLIHPASSSFVRDHHTRCRGQMTVCTSPGACAPNLGVQVQRGPPGPGWPGVSVPACGKEGYRCNFLIANKQNFRSPVPSLCLEATLMAKVVSSPQTCFNSSTWKSRGRWIFVSSRPSWSI